jgi:hypothetical protein
MSEASSAAGSPRAARGVLDTSTVILLQHITDPTALPAEPLITAATLAELAVDPLVAAEERERAARQAHLQQAEADFDPLSFDADAARASAESPPRCGAPGARRPPAPTTRWSPRQPSPTTCPSTRATRTTSAASTGSG